MANYLVCATNLDRPMAPMWIDSTDPLERDLAEREGCNAFSLYTYSHKPGTFDKKPIIYGDLLIDIRGLDPYSFMSCGRDAIVKICSQFPKFKFDYKLKLLEDLKKLGITDVFDSSKADLSNLTSQKGTYIYNTEHKATIEFTQDGIKASAVTTAGGAGMGGSFDYLYKVPVERIDLTFNKPYMFIVRDKSTGEVWFTGTVYEPLLVKDDSSIEYFSLLNN